MSLFDSLYRLLPSGQGCLEDFHTEIVAHVFQNFPDLALAWLREIGATKLTESDDFIVGTQEEYFALETHSTGSRPDIVIRIRNGECLELVFIESKIGSSEGELQLERYAEHLATRTDASSRTLIYLTRDYEPKSVGVKSVKFLVKRWSEFYRFFRTESHRSDILTELLHLMEKHNMSQSNRFTAIDLIALTNFPKARKLMDQTLWEGIDKEFANICGKYSNKETALFQFKNYGRYVLRAQDGPFEVLLGYWLDQDTVVDSPLAGGAFQINPKAPNRSEIVSLLRNFEKLKSGAWKEFQLSDEKGWGSLRRQRTLESFFGEEDHVSAVTHFLQEVLQDMADFKANCPDLWSLQPVEP